MVGIAFLMLVSFASSSMQSFHGTYLRTHVQQRLQVVQASRKSPSNSIARPLLLSHFFMPFELLRSSNEFQLPQSRAYYYNRLSGKVGWERSDVETGGGAESDQPSGGATDL